MSYIFCCTTTDVVSKRGIHYRYCKRLKTVGRVLLSDMTTTGHKWRFPLHGTDNSGLDFKSDYQYLQQKWLKIPDNISQQPEIVMVMTTLPKGTIVRPAYGLQHPGEKLRVSIWLRERQKIVGTLHRITVFKMAAPQGCDTVEKARLVLEKKYNNGLGCCPSCNSCNEQE